MEQIFEKACAVASIYRLRSLLYKLRVITPSEDNMKTIREVNEFYHNYYRSLHEKVRPEET